MDAVDDVQGIIRRVGDVQASIYPGDCRVIKSALPNVGRQVNVSEKSEAHRIVVPSMLSGYLLAAASSLHQAYNES